MDNLPRVVSLHYNDKNKLPKVIIFQADEKGVYVKATCLTMDETDKTADAVEIALREPLGINDEEVETVFFAENGAATVIHKGKNTKGRIVYLTNIL